MAKAKAKDVCCYSCPCHSHPGTPQHSHWGWQDELGRNEGVRFWTPMRTTAEWSQVECKPRKHKTSKPNVYILWQLSQQRVLLSEFLQGAHEVLTPAELRLEHHCYTGSTFLESLFQYRILRLSLKAGAETWSQNRTLVQFSSFTPMAPLVVQKAFLHHLQHSFP